MIKAAATKRYRALAKVRVQALRCETGPWQLARVTATFFHHDDRRRDPDNSMGSIKAVYDGIVDAGLVVDDDAKHMKRGEPTFEVDPEYPRVVLTIERLK